MFLRKCSTNWINLCQDHEDISEIQRECVELYCHLVKSSMNERESREASASGEATTLKIQGEYLNPSGSSIRDRSVFTQDLLLKFLVNEVSEIKDFETRICKKKIQFWAKFITRSKDSENFLFNLRNWPLGVGNLNLWNWKLISGYFVNYINLVMNIWIYAV